MAINAMTSTPMNPPIAKANAIHTETISDLPFDRFCRCQRMGSRLRARTFTHPGRRLRSQGRWLARVDSRSRRRLKSALSSLCVATCESAMRAGWSGTEVIAFLRLGDDAATRLAPGRRDRGGDGPNEQSQASMMPSDCEQARSSSNRIAQLRHLLDAAVLITIARISAATGRTQ